MAVPRKEQLLQKVVDAEDAQELELVKAKLQVLQSVEDTRE